MFDYIPKSKKSPAVKKIINEALDILKSVGIPFEGKTSRALENTAMAFLAVAGVTNLWKAAKGQGENRHLTSKQIVDYVNAHYEEHKSRGSYDDIKRRDLLHLTLADLVLNSADNPTASHNDPTRGNTLSGEFRSLLLHYNTKEWEIKLKLFSKNRPDLEEILKRKRDLPKVQVKLPSGITLQLSQGPHNHLQREILDEFLPRFGNECTVLYIGDATDRYLLRLDDQLKELGFFEISNKLLPDIVAYDSKRNWVYLIEAFYSSGPMSEERIFELKKLLKDCKADLIFVTAFTTKLDFKKNASEIGWESEVWTADNPDHIIHFNGDKFLGPHK